SDHGPRGLSAAGEDGARLFRPRPQDRRCRGQGPAPEARPGGHAGGQGLMAARVITVNRDTKPGIYPVLVGMAITFKNMIGTMFGRSSATVQFPEEKRKTSGRYRGVHILTQREDGTPKCVACYMCATVCPAECIYIEAGERPEQTIEKYPTRFE